DVSAQAAVGAIPFDGADRRRAGARRSSASDTRRVCGPDRAGGICGHSAVAHAKVALVVGVPPGRDVGSVRRNDVSGMAWLYVPPTAMGHGGVLPRSGDSD